MSTQPGLVWRLRKAWFDARLRWQYHGRRRLERLRFLRALPWSVWCFLCAWNAEVVVGELGRRSRRPLHFVQIGSNDGLANDPLHATVLRYGWSGVLVEPLPQLFERLRQTYEGATDLKFANVAISTGSGKATIFRVDPRPGDPEWVAQIASLDRSVVLRHSSELPSLESRLVPVEVESLSLADLIDRYGVVSLDLLHIDAEGFDHEILRQVSLRAPWAPRFVIFEKKHMSPERYLENRSRYKRAGYRFVNLWPDELAYRDAPRSRASSRGYPERES